MHFVLILAWQSMIEGGMEGGWGMPPTCSGKHMMFIMQLSGCKLLIFLPCDKLRIKSPEKLDKDTLKSTVCKVIQMALWAGTAVTFNTDHNTLSASDTYINWNTHFVFSKCQWEHVTYTSFVTFCRIYISQRLHHNMNVIC